MHHNEFQYSDLLKPEILSSDDNGRTKSYKKLSKQCSFHNLTKVLTADDSHDNDDSNWPKTTAANKRVLLDNISGIVHPGEILAIMGVSEPTTGLDSALATSLIQLLRNLADEQRKTVILSIHQPSSQIFQTFDKVMLISQGAIVFMTNEKQWKNFKINFHGTASEFPGNKICGTINIEPDSARQLIEKFILLVNDRYCGEFDHSYKSISITGFDITKEENLIKIQIQALPYNKK
ncbi:unnamed protein product [Rotaria sordida]|uniref:Uncharacterized protein n=1 Tax=Rotaria sordida TaxID=392033 RepID=A0A814GZG6_9BILA|nr:unnamed protein product [Rotaria sordida]CAF1095294.1 unnamed protein product [Rotaria sordida]